MDYKEYLKSPQWENLKQMRRKLDSNKCCICDKPFDLEVHHLTYENKENERIEDLITLCRYHHGMITKYCKSQKYYPDKYQQITFLFCLYAKNKDKASIGGNGLNLTNLDVIYQESEKFNKKIYQRTGTAAMDIQGFFRDLRIAKIAELKKQGADNDWILGQYGFSKSMVSRYKADSKPFETGLYKIMEESE